MNFAQRTRFLLLSFHIGRGIISATSFKSYSKTLNEYKDTLSEIQQKNIDLSQTQFGNIDTNNRQLLEWNDLNLSKFKDELISWNEGISWDDIKNDLKKSVSTIYGSVPILSI